MPKQKAARRAPKQAPFPLLSLPAAALRAVVEAVQRLPNNSGSDLPLACRALRQEADAIVTSVYFADVDHAPERMFTPNKRNGLQVASAAHLADRFPSAGHLRMPSKLQSSNALAAVMAPLPDASWPSVRSVKGCFTAALLREVLRLCPNLERCCVQPHDGDERGSVAGLLTLLREWGGETKLKLFILDHWDAWLNDTQEPLPSVKCFDFTGDGSCLLDDVDMVTIHRMFPQLHTLKLRGLDVPRFPPGVRWDALTRLATHLPAGCELQRVAPRLEALTYWVPSEIENPSKALMGLPNLGSITFTSFCDEDENMFDGRDGEGNDDTVGTEFLLSLPQVTRLAFTTWDALLNCIDSDAARYMYNMGNGYWQHIRSLRLALTGCQSHLFADMVSRSKAAAWLQEFSLERCGPLPSATDADAMMRMLLTSMPALKTLALGFSVWDRGEAALRALVAPLREVRSPALQTVLIRLTRAKQRNGSFGFGWDVMEELERENPGLRIWVGRHWKPMI